MHQCCGDWFHLGKSLDSIDVLNNAKILELVTAYRKALWCRNFWIWGECRALKCTKNWILGLHYCTAFPPAQMKEKGTHLALWLLVPVSALAASVTRRWDPAFAWQLVKGFGVLAVGWFVGFSCCQQFLSFQWWVPSPVLFLFWFRCLCRGHDITWWWVSSPELFGSESKSDSCELFSQ